MVVKVGAYTSLTPIIIRTVTNLHIGVGQTAGLVDLPIQRDSLGFPNIPASSIKGVLRSHVFKSCEKCEKAIFGSRPEERETFTGALAVLDAILLAFPARSLKGVYCHVTSPLLLERAISYLSLLGEDSEHVRVIRDILEKVEPREDQAFTNEEVAKLIGINGNVILNEEYTLKLEKNESVSDLINLFSRRLDMKKLVIVNDDIALALVDRGLIRTYRIRLKPETKTVETGGLWSEEYVPRDTIFLTIFLYSNLRVPNNKRCEEHLKNGKDSEVKKRIEELCLKQNQGYLIFGGHETIGYGLVKLLKWEVRE